jgi:hypothetical protein
VDSRSGHVKKSLCRITEYSLRIVPAFSVNKTTIPVKEKSVAKAESEAVFSALFSDGVKNA